MRSGRAGRARRSSPPANPATPMSCWSRSTASCSSVAVPSTRVAALACSSHHHQGLDRVGAGMTVTGRSDDGLVEAIELVVEDPEHDGWMVGVQWHPEDTAEADPAQRGLFEGFTTVAKWRG